MLPRFGRPGLAAIAANRRGASRLGHTIEELDDPTQTIKVEQVLHLRLGRSAGRKGVVGTAQGDGGVAPVGESNDQVRVTTSTLANDLDALTAEGMMRMSDGDES
jgi:hypothetical protein